MLIGAAAGGARRMMGNRSPGAVSEPVVNTTPPGQPPVTEALPTVRNSTATQGPVDRISLPGVDDARIISGAPQIEGSGVRLGLPAPDPRLAAPVDPALLNAPPRQIAGPPGPQPDARPIANPAEAIQLPAAPASAALDKAVGGTGDVEAPVRRARSPRARAKSFRPPG